MILPGQFAVLMGLRLVISDDLSRRRVQAEELTEEEIRLYYKIYIVSGDPLLENITLTEDNTILREVWKLVRVVYEESFHEEPSRLDDVVEYMLETLQRAGSKEYFFTPPVVAELMIGLLKPEQGKLWDPACGSGAFLCQAAERLRQERKLQQVFLRGTDISRLMLEIAGSNLWLHDLPRRMRGITYDTIQNEDRTRLEVGDAFEVEEEFDYIVANPPVSSIYASMNETRGHIAPTRALHLQFLQHIMKSLKRDGRAVVLVNESLLFSVKSVERAIRRSLVTEYGLRTVVSLPKGVFAPYTNAKSSVLLFGGRGQAASEVLFYDMEYVGYSLDKNRYLQERNDIPNVLEKEEQREELYRSWHREKDRYPVYNAHGVCVPGDWKESKIWFADREQILEKDCILSPGTYQPRPEEVEQETERPEELLQQLLTLEEQIQEQLERIYKTTYGE